MTSNELTAETQANGYDGFLFDKSTNQSQRLSHKKIMIVGVSEEVGSDIAASLLHDGAQVVGIGASTASVKEMLVKFPKFGFIGMEKIASGTFKDKYDERIDSLILCVSKSNVPMF
jgi:NAD(P)-dependent dehydrogenase (short-subunit alcohol dehydrogenase family)